MVSVLHGRTPALFRAGDIGVASDWRDLTSDWAPLITGTGVLIYSALRDYYDGQRVLRPFLLDPHGPSKRYIQHLIGRKTAHSLQGPEYLLATIGLLHVEIVRGGGDELRPNHTVVAYYVVGVLSRPELTWPTVERVLDALMPGLGEPMDADAQRAQTRQAAAAIRALAQAGMLSNEDPAHVFNPDGAWVGLLPQLIQDARWEALFQWLHGEPALGAYRRAARAWVAYALRRAATLRAANDANADLLLAASRRGGGGSGAASTTGTTPQIVDPTHERGPASADDVPADDVPATDAPPLENYDVPGTAVRADLGGVSLNQTPFNVPGDSPECPRGISLNQTPPGTDRDGEHPAAADHTLSQTPTLSQARNQNQRDREGNQETPDLPGTPSAGTGSVDLEASRRRSARREQPLDLALAVEPFLHDTELYTASLDRYFWTMVGEIVGGTPHARYAYTAAERKALQRLQAQGTVSIGVLLACLRALRTLPELVGVTSLAAFLKHPAWAATFALARQVVVAMPDATPEVLPAAPERGWDLFLHEFRRIGGGAGLRNVRVAEVQLLSALFARMPQECWEVLDRVERCATPVQLSYAYLDAAIKRNLRVTAERALSGARPSAGDGRPAPALPPHSTRRPPAAMEPFAVSVGPLTPPAAATVDPQLGALLACEALPADMLTPAMTLAYVEAWVRFVDQNRGRIRNRRAYLMHVLPVGRWPDRAAGATRPPIDRASAAVPAPTPQRVPGATPTPDGAPTRLDAPSVWSCVLAALKQQLRPVDFDTWLPGTELVQVTEDEAVVAVPHVFARQELETHYHAVIEAALSATLHRPVAVALVIGG